MDHFSDEPGLVTWVYPFREFHEKVFGGSPRPGDIFFSDWFMRNAVNAGLPVNTIVSTDNFLSSLSANPTLYQDTILLTPLPTAGSPLEAMLIERLHSGQSVFLYGPATHASRALQELLNLKVTSPITGELEVRSSLESDHIRHGRPATRMLHRDVTSGGGIDTVVLDPGAADFEVCSTVSNATSERIFAITRRIGSGRLAWVRGSLSSYITNAYLPQPDDPKQLFQAEHLMRYMLAKFGYELRVEKPTIATRNPLVLVARSNNGFFFSGYNPSTAVTIRLRFPHGAPILHGYETWLENGHSSYSMPRAWHRECRCFVEQAVEGEVSCVERISEEIGVRRRLMLTGLKSARVHFYPEIRPAGPPVRMESGRPRATFFDSAKRIVYAPEESGRRLVARDISGDLLISW
jgi:hypothetical protein